MKKSISLLIFVVMALFSACNLHEQPEIDNGDATTKYIDLQITIPGIETKTRAIGAAEENAIKTIDVLAFKVDGTSETFDYAVTGTKIGLATGTNGSEQAFSVEVQIKEYPQRFVVISNASSAVTTIVEGASVGANKSTMLAGLHLLLTGDNRWKAISSTDYSAFPMWGESDPETITSSTSKLANSIQMLRMVAKINVQLDQSDENVTNVFKLKSVHLYNTNTKGHVVPKTANVNAGKVIAPTIPTGDIRHTGPIEYTDFGTPRTTDLAMHGAIYLFETAKDDAITDRLKATCVVIGGLYGSDTKQSYYRVDFKKSGAFIDILRNHQYIVNITKVSGRGHDTVDEAFRAISINMETDILVWNEGAQVNVRDDQYMLSVSEKEFHFEGTQIAADNTFNVFTDYTSGWSVEKVVDDATGTTPEWLMLLPENGAANVDGTITLTAPQNDSDADRSATIWIAAGRLRVTVKVTQEMYTIAKRFARSNVVWTGTKLTFAVTAEDNETIPANVQGVFFKWGSLFPVSPVGQTFATSKLLYRPTGYAGTTPTNWGSVPYLSETDPPFDNSQITEDDFATYYNNNTGFNAATGKGDICRYISRQPGWVNGDWRLPTAYEYAQLIAEASSVPYGSFDDITSVSSGNNSYGNYANGYYQPASGRLLGKGATNGVSTTKPAVGVFFPAGGNRNNIPGDGYNAGREGFYWSGSSQILLGGSAHYMLLYSDRARIANVVRVMGHPVRCIRVD